LKQTITGDFECGLIGHHAISNRAGDGGQALVNLRWYPILFFAVDFFAP
jgi:hypothetical protein